MKISKKIKNNNKSSIPQEKQKWRNEDQTSMKDRSTSQDNSSPTVGTKSFFLMAVIFAAESPHVVTIDIEGAFLHRIMTNEVYMQLQGQ